MADTVFIGGSSVGSEIGLKAARRRERMRQLALGKEKAAQMPDGDEHKKLLAAVQRFEFNIHGAEMAQLAARSVPAGQKTSMVFITSRWAT